MFFKDQSHISTTGRRLSMVLGCTESAGRSPNMGPNVAAEQWCEQLKLGLNRVRFETNCV